MIVTLARPILNYMTATEKPRDIGVQTEMEDSRRGLGKDASG